MRTQPPKISQRPNPWRTRSGAASRPSTNNRRQTRHSAHPGTRSATTGNVCRPLNERHADHHNPTAPTITQAARVVPSTADTRHAERSPLARSSNRISPHIRARRTGAISRCPGYRVKLTAATTPDDEPTNNPTPPSPRVSTAQQTTRATATGHLAAAAPMPNRSTTRRNQTRTSRPLNGRHTPELRRHHTHAGHHPRNSAQTRRHNPSIVRVDHPMDDTPTTVRPVALGIGRTAHVIRSTADARLAFFAAWRLAPRPGPSGQPRLRPNPRVSSAQRTTRGARPYATQSVRASAAQWRYAYSLPTSRATRSRRSL